MKHSSSISAYAINGFSLLPETAPKRAGNAVLGTLALKISRGSMPLIPLEQIAQALFCLGVWDL